MTHVPALDGVRGLAILLVLLYHSDRLGDSAWPDRLLHSVMRSGWCGVDLFFVLSGFLITGILLDSVSAPSYLRDFYARRVLRIVPVYYAFLAVVILVLPAVLSRLGPDYRRLLGNQAWYWSFLVNLLVARQGWDATPLNTGALWSLAVEEQFYLVWPWVVLFLSRRQLIALGLLTLPVALGSRLHLLMQGADPAAVYVLTHTRMDTLAAGALLALGLRQPGGPQALARWTPRLATAAVLTLLALLARRGHLDQDEFLVQTLGFSALAMAAASLVRAAVLAHPGGRLHALLTRAWLTALGRYSYALYLFHDPVNLLVETHLFRVSDLPALFGSRLPGQAAFFAAGSGLSLALAWLSWHTVERRALILKRRFAPPSG